MVLPAAALTGVPRPVTEMDKNHKLIRYQAWLTIYELHSFEEAQNII